MNLPIRTRLTLWYVGLLAVILIVVGAFLLVRLQAGLIAGVDTNLDDHANDVAIDLQGGGGRSFQDLTASSLRALSRGAFAAQLESTDGRVLLSTDEPTGRQPMITASVREQVLRGDPVRLTSQLGPERARFRVLAVPYSYRGATDVLVVARSLVDVDESVRRLRLLLVVAVPVAVAVAGAGGWMLARKALLPVGRMTLKAGVISADRLQERLAVPRPRDELGRLAGTLNDMLDRIERGVQEQQRLVADASHELRTPLAVMRSEIDVWLRAPGLPAQAREALESVGEEVERMSRILDNLLTLARIDEGRLDLLCAPQRLDELVGDVLDKLRPIAQAKGIALEVGGEGAEVLADGPRFELVITNLVDNAIKYTGPGGSVRVRLWRDRQEAGISVSDTGPGIREDALPHLFDRFYRADAARSRAAGGSGLGLAICREIVTAHGGRLWAESTVGVGSSFSLAMPLAGETIRVAPAGS
jgi:heavy metal sensor kinase